MQEEIFERIMESRKAAAIKYMKILGTIDEDFDEESYKVPSYRTDDLKRILAKLKLIKNTVQNYNIIDEFHEDLYKLALEIGIKRGKILIINVVKEGNMDYSKIMAVETKKFSNIQIEPDIIIDFKKQARKGRKKSKHKDSSLGHVMAVEFSKKEHETISELKEEQLNVLVDRLNIDRDLFERISKKIVLIRPNSREYHFESEVYRKHNGKYKVRTLLHQYMESVLKEGMAIGMQFGKKFMFEDLQNHRFSREDVENMTDEEIERYCGEVVDDIWS